MPIDQNEPAKKEPPVEQEASMAEARRASEALKAKIAAVKAHNDLPLDSTLGNPEWDKNAADGHLDLPDDEDDGWPPSQAKANKTPPP
jgi:hypothetical protein